MIDRKHHTVLFLFFTAAIVLCSYHSIESSFFPEHLKNTTIAKLKEVDSLVYYQCHAEAIKEQKVTTEDGKVIELKGKKQFITITEKFKLSKKGETYRLEHYNSPTTYYPNKKYTYLKLTEKAYWGFSKDMDTILPKEDVLKLAAYETKLRSITEYDFKVIDNNGPQLIINGKKISEQ
ncbi:MAG TPA: hypothetical protein VGF30_14735, partial [Bacteroidia bacterium]